MSDYADYAQYYDYDVALGADIAFYRAFAEQCGDPILELACGTGRVLVPLAEAGFRIVGVDLSKSMLARCREKVVENGLEDRVRLVHGDMAAFELERKGFALIFIAFRSFMHLFTHEDQLACLQQVRDHLRPTGTFVADLYAPDYARLAESPNGPFHLRRSFDLPNGRRVIRRERFLCNDPLNQIQHSEICFEEYDEKGALVRLCTVPMDTRYTFRYELQLLLERVGLEVVTIYRDYEKNPYDGTGEIIAVARRPIVA